MLWFHHRLRSVWVQPVIKNRFFPVNDMDRYGLFKILVPQLVKMALQNLLYEKWHHKKGGLKWHHKMVPQCGDNAVPLRCHYGTKVVPYLIKMAHNRIEIGTRKTKLITNSRSILDFDASLTNFTTILLKVVHRIIFYYNIIPCQ